MNLSENAPKYSKDAPFTDPVVRCDSCAKIALSESFRNLGMCPHCGCRKLRNVLIMNAEESALVKHWGVDPDWLALFHEVSA